MYSSNNNTKESQVDIALGTDTSALECVDIHATLNEFNKLFEDQLNSINSESKESLEKKIQIYEEWVKRLLEEIATLVDCIQEMENQTAQGLDILTQNLSNDSEPAKRFRALKNDLKAMVEIIRRARAYGEWNIDGLELQYLTFEQVFGDESKNYKISEIKDLNPSSPHIHAVNIEMDAANKRFQLSADISQTTRDIYEIDNDHANILEAVKANYAEQDIEFKKLERLNAELKEEIEKLRAKNKELAETNINTKVLVNEVAARHDQITKLKNENNELEEQLKSQEKTLHFKDQIIKEMRKDYKKFAASTPPMTTKTFRSSSNTESLKSLDISRDDMCSEKSYDRKTDITNRLLEIFNYVQSSYQPTAYPCQSDSSILSDYMPPIGNDVISDEELNNALTSFVSRMTYLEKENTKFQTENEKLKELLEEKTSEVDILMRKQNSTQIHATTVGDGPGKLATHPTSSDVEDGSTSPNIQTTLQAEQDAKNDDTLSLNREVVSLAKLAITLQQEIASKDEILREKNNIIASFREYREDLELPDVGKRKLFSYDSNSNAEVVEKHLSDHSMTVKMGDADQLANLVVDLQKEIASKDKLLKEKDEMITSLRECESSKHREVVDLRKRMDAIQCNNNRNDETVINLRDALDIHIKTINQQKLGNNYLEKKIKDLQFYITNVDSNYALLQEKYRKLEVECNDQLTTISNLRSVVEEYSKRSGHSNPTVSSSSTANTNTHNTSSIWKWWRNVHDV